MSEPGSEQREEAVVEVQMKDTRHGMIGVLSDVDAGQGARAPTDAERKASELHNKILDRIDESAYESGDVIAQIRVPDDGEPWVDWNEDVVGAAGDDPHIECDGSATATEREETTNEKGDRHENEARHILKRVYGAGVSKVGCRGVHDPFGFVDLIAMRPGEPVKFVQVKTNGFSAESRRKYRRRTRKLPPEHATLEVWVRHDRQGWVLHEYDPEAEEFRQFHEIDVCDRSDAGDEYREFVERQEQLVTDGGPEQTGTERFLNLDRDDDPHLRGLDGERIDGLEEVGPAYFVEVDGERVLVAEHEIEEREVRADGGERTGSERSKAEQLAEFIDEHPEPSADHVLGRCEECQQTVWIDTGLRPAGMAESCGEHEPLCQFRGGHCA